MIGTILALLGKKGRNFLWNGLGNIWNRYTGSGLTTAEQETNAYNAQQAQEQRDWEQSMRDTSFQAQVADMRKAGLNTALMYGGVGSSGATVPSGASASGVTPSSGNITDLFGSIMEMALLGAQAKNINADTELKKADARKSLAGAENIERLTPLQERELTSRIREINQNVSESEARESLAIVQTINVSKNTEWYDKLAQSEIDLRDSQKDLNDAMQTESRSRVDEIEQRIKNLKQEVVESFARMAVYSANAGYLDQQTLNAMEEQKLIEVRRAGARTEYLINEKVLQNYDTDKWFIRAQQGFSAARDLGIGVGSIMSGGLFASKPNKIGY